MLHEIQQMRLEHRESPPEVEGAIRGIYDKYESSLVSAAVSAEQRAVHWDDKNRSPKMHVGCSVLALGKELNLSEPAIYTGANSKPEPGDMLAYPKRKCAEMNALENILGVDYKGKIKAKGAEEVEKEDLGLILAIVTVSESKNTGEVDTADHDVVYPCKQCMTNYKYLVKQGVLSPNTIIFNARTKDGKVETGEAIALGSLIEKFDRDMDAKNTQTIVDLMKVKEQAMKAYLESVVAINRDIEEQAKKIQRHHNLNGPETENLIAENLRDLQREKTERIWAEMDVCSNTIYQALKSAVEEGVSKQLMVGSLGLKGVHLDDAMESLSKSDLDLILDELRKPLIEKLPEKIL